MWDEGTITSFLARWSAISAPKDALSASVSSMILCRRGR